MDESTQREIVNHTCTIKRPSWRNVRCARCDVRLESGEFTETTSDGAWLDLRGRGTLTLAVRPHYGGYVDSLCDTEQWQEDEFIVCKACVDQLHAEVPGLDRLLARIAAEA